MASEMGLSDSIIINELKKGNEQVYQSLFKDYYPSLLKLAYGFLFDEDISKDLIQDIFVTMWEQRQSLNIKSLKWYLYTAVKNKCLTHLRNIGIKDKHSIYILDYYLLNNTDNDFESELSQQVNDALKQLPPEMKRVFQLKYLHDLTMNEIAEDLDISVSTVKTQLSRAKQKLRKLLSKNTQILFFL